MIVFPIIFTSDSTFIHELNHAITSSVLAYSEFLDIEKSGIYVSDENKKKKNTLLFEELLNHKSAMEIANIFYELGGTLFNNEHSFNANIQSEHELFFPLINEFYEKYKDLLKEARISENRNILFRDMDYQQFYNLNYQINHVYRSKKISYRDLKKNNKLVLNLVKKDS